MARNWRSGTLVEEGLNRSRSLAPSPTAPQPLPGPTPGRRPRLLNAELAGPMAVQASAHQYPESQKRRDCGSRGVGPAIRRPPLSGSDTLSHLIDAAQRAHTVRRTAELAKPPLLRAASD